MTKRHKLAQGAGTFAGTCHLRWQVKIQPLRAVDVRLPPLPPLSKKSGELGVAECRRSLPTSVAMVAGALTSVRSARKKSSAHRVRASADIIEEH